MIGIAKGVVYLHQESINHRDLNLSNILLDSKMNPKISGFGLSRTIEDDQPDMSTVDVETLYDMMISIPLSLISMFFNT